LGNEKWMGLLFDEDVVKKILEIEDEKKEEDEEEDDYFVYQPMVYPPGSTPPTSNISKKMNLIDFHLFLK
jgi:hypothetical protein